MSKKAYLDSLAGLSDDDSASSSGSEGEGGEGGGAGKGAAAGAAGAAAAAKRQKNTIDLDTLQAHGYVGGPSILFVPDKAKDEQSWAWTKGAAHKGGETEEETYTEREANRTAVNEGAEASAMYARKAVQQAEALRQQKKEEQQQLKNDKKLSWNQKEKRKRDEGKATRGKNYVEEEKRLARSLGVYSGFDK